MSAKTNYAQLISRKSGPHPVRKQYKRGKERQLVRQVLEDAMSDYETETSNNR